MIVVWWQNFAETTVNMHFSKALCNQIMIGFFFNDIRFSGSLPSILNFYNENFYNSQLIATICAETSKEAIQLRELSTILPRSYDATDNPFGIYFVNVLGQNERIENRKSWSNQQESEIVSFQKTICKWS